MTKGYLAMTAPSAGELNAALFHRSCVIVSLRAFPMEYAVTAGFLLAVVAGSCAAVILGGYGIVHLIASAL